MHEVKTIYFFFLLQSYELLCLLHVPVLIGRIYGHFYIRYPAGYPASQIRYPVSGRISDIKKGRIIRAAGYPVHP
jgi:hypothetical protein